MWKTSQRRNRGSQSWILKAHSFEAMLSFILETKKATELYDFQYFKECFVHFTIVFKAYSYYFSLQKEDEHFLFQSYAVDQEKTDMMILCPQENSQICYLHLIKKIKSNVYPILVERDSWAFIWMFIQILSHLGKLYMANAIGQATLLMSWGRDKSHIHDECEKTFLDTFWKEQLSSFGDAFDILILVHK